MTDREATVLETPVRDAMRDVVSALAPDTLIATAARLFVERHISGAPVVDAAGCVLGVVSQTDLVAGLRTRSDIEGRNAYYVVLHGRPVIEAAVPEYDARVQGIVQDVMTRHVIMVAPDAPLREAVRVMVAEQVHRLLVIEHGRLAGVVTSMDVLRMFAPGALPVASSGF